MPDHARTRIAATVGVFALGGAVAVPTGDLQGVAAITVALIAAHALSVPSPSGRPTPLTVGVLVAGLILLGGSPTPIVIGGVMGIAGGWWVVAVRHGVRLADDMTLGEGAAAAAFLAVAGGLEVALAHVEVAASPAHLIAATLGSLAWFGAESLARARMPGPRRRTSARLQWWRSLSDWPVVLTMVATGSLFAVTLPTMGPWALMVAGVPYGFADAAFRRLRTTRRTYAQTIAAMGRIPEAAGQVPVGHAARSADVAAAIAAELGMTAGRADRISEASLLLEMGRVVLANPGMAGGTYSPDDVAAWSAAIVGDSDRLGPVAELVVQAPRPYRRVGQERDPELSPAAHVVKVADAYERYRDEGLEPLDALERLHRGAAYDFDPDVVHALRKVLVRRGSLGV